MDSTGVQQIVAALQSIHSPATSNADRQKAQEFLETVKAQEDAPLWGWQLALPEQANDPVVRHFGLTLIQHSIQYNFILYSEAKRRAVRDWVIELATKVSENDKHFIKEKIAFLWVALAKRVWGAFAADGSDESSELLKDASSSESVQPAVAIPADESALQPDGWVSMDQTLYEMWLANNSTKELVLIIFRTLFEDLFMIEDPVSAKRGTILGALCIEVVTSEHVLTETYSARVPSLRKCRHGTDGWLRRWSDLLGECLTAGPTADPLSQRFSVKVLQTLKTCLHWVLPLELRSAQLLDRLSACIDIDCVPLRTLATDCLHALFTRHYSSDEDFQHIVGAVFMPAGIATLARVYRSVAVDASDIDEQAYALLKKLVEMIVGLGEFLNVTKQTLPAGADIAGYLELVLATTQHPSLIISGLSLQFWCSVLRIELVLGNAEVLAVVPRLLETAADRLLPYDSVPPDHEARRFLETDFDSAPDIAVFVDNYRKFMDDIVRLAVCRQPQTGLAWIGTRLAAFFNSAEGQAVLQPGLSLSERDMPCLYAQAQFALVEAGLRGLTRWKIWYTGEDKAEQQQQLESLVEQICNEMLGLTVPEPRLRGKHIQTLVQFAPLLKTTQEQLMFRVLEQVLQTCTVEAPENGGDEDREAVRDLRTLCGTELNRLAYMMPEALRGVYDDLERVVAQLISSGRVTEHEAVALKSFLLVVSQRSAMPDKAEKFVAIVDPELAAWTAESTVQGLMDLPWFMERVGVVRIAEYFRSRGITADTDLLQAKMDDAGRALKAELKSKWSALFPIRATRIYIQYTIEKLPHDSEAYRDLLSLWKPRVQPIVPHVLQLIRQTQAYFNPDNWAELPSEVQAFVRYSTQERLWQVGVSIKSKDTFVEENVRAMHTLRDFADSVGHIVSYTREYAFLTLGSISQLEDTLYELPNIAENLWLALAGDAKGVTSHVWRHMINLVVRQVVRNCPKGYIASFMPEFLPRVLRQLDALLAEKWQAVYLHGVLLVGDEDEETLSAEMMEEYLLRQLTAIVDRLLIDLVGPVSSHHGGPKSGSGLSPEAAELRRVVLGTKEILAPFLQLCVNIVGYRDTRCSFNACLVLRNVLPEILLKDSEVDEFLCRSLVKTCTEVLSDPYFADVHGEAGYVFVILYTALRKKYEEPARLLAELLTAKGNVAAAQVEQFDEKVRATNSLRQQRGLLLELVMMANKTMEASEANDMRSREALQKAADKKAQKEKLQLMKEKQQQKQSHDVMDDPFIENALSGIFDQ